MPEPARKRQRTAQRPAMRKEIAEAKARNDSEGAIEEYWSLTRTYPLSGKVWTEFAEYAMSLKDEQLLEKVFAASLPTVVSHKLFEVYIKYVTSTSTQPGAAEQAYEFALQKIQHERSSGPIFQQYLQFLEKKSTSTTWEQQHKMDELRRTYRKAVSLPVTNIEQLWRAYNSFENGVSRSTARKFIDERSGSYMQARSCLREIETLSAGISCNDCPESRKFDAEEHHQLELWRRLVSYEQSNPLGLDESVLNERIYCVFKQALTCLCFFPEMWYDAIQFCVDVNDSAQALELCKLALQVNPLSFALTARLATFYEENDDTKQVFATWRTLIDSLKTTDLYERLTVAYAELMQATKRLLGVVESRKISTECRKLAHCSFQIYTASAAIELQNNEPKSALKIYQIAYKRFKQQPSFIQSYLKFLFTTGDMLNARVVFEKALNDLGPVEARVIYDQILEYEATYADLTVLSRLEARYRQLYTVDVIDLAARRYQQYYSDPVGQELRKRTTAAKPSSVERLLSALPPLNMQINVEELMVLVQNA